VYHCAIGAADTLISGVGPHRVGTTRLVGNPPATAVAGPETDRAIARASLPVR